MRVEKLPFEKVQAFSKLFLAYCNNETSLSSFYGEKPTIDGFGDILKRRQFPQKNRETLVTALKSQYESLEHHEAVDQNIERLGQDKTYTITTGHQLNLYTGPLYFIYKIATVVNACRKLKQAYPQNDFVPVYWMASEDHDFEEINHFRLNGQKYTWESNQTGPVGRFDTSPMEDFLSELPEKVELFEKAYRGHSTLAEACRCYVHQLFGEEGVVVVDGDHADLKSQFAPVIKEEILNQSAQPIVEATNQKLIDAGYNSQAFSREINFFYLDGTSRERIVESDGTYKVRNTSLSFSKDEMLQEIDEHPERFSPNVILRPVYQEVILPNIGYTGGPAEVAYWLQLKGVFDLHQVSFPILLPRNFGMVISRNVGRKIHKLELGTEDLFKDIQSLKAWQLSKYGENHVLEADMKSITEIFNGLKSKAVNIDKSLEGYIGSEESKAIKNMENIQRKLKKALESKNEVAMRQIDAIKENLFPGNGLQERTLNFLTFYLEDPAFVRDLLANFDAFDMRFHVLWQE